ncbi:D-2-hydroxyacid dehydrogenase [Pseudalkalibacillus caeni]|uniref:D-2-hydroxyacid dehydrogenase n=1 Tax=Exobacillus caeni TaxID=2574798 RepID=A0A5R9F0N3_9BACL|nr:D-2-hydroxyacid dehydrogenase [Pseudalkalibacillus caeni]TLS35970.1 D-2-hydroxyacid dehydrogenase [Pseudalkalibacillus caeni]
MQKRKMVITHNLDEKYVNRINELVPDWDVIVGKDRDTWENHLQDAEVVAGWKKGIGDQLFGDNAKLRWLQTWSAGVNSIPLEKFEQNDVYVTSANGVHSYPISETIFALMLGLTRKIDTYVRNQAAKTWHHSNLKLEIHGKTLGLIGVGAIGRETAKIAKAFDMTVLGVRNSGNPAENVDEMFTPEELHSILPRCDYVVVTVPLTEKTQHLFGAGEFNLMKESSFFINIGRGRIVVEEDLIAALKDNKIAGAGLDVFEQEPLPEESPLWKMEKVIITPHTAGSTEHYNKRVIEDIFIPNLKNYLKGEEPSVNLVDFSKGY